MPLPKLPILHASTIALSAFLLFLVQPVIAKQILPWFGGSAAVWTTCMVFFQAVLLAGYAYSDLLVRRLAPRRQAMLHAALLLASVAWLPITVDEAFKPPDAANPIGRIVILLTATIGLPYLMLSTTGPLVQAWFARAHTGRRVYRLYALSNAASMAALLAYPPLIEPAATSRQQSLGWSAGYAAFVLLGLAAAWRAARSAPAVPPTRSAAPAQTASAARAAFATAAAGSPNPAAAAVAPAHSLAAPDASPAAQAPSTAAHASSPAAHAPSAAAHAPSAAAQAPSPAAHGQSPAPNAPSCAAPSPPAPATAAALAPHAPSLAEHGLWLLLAMLGSVLLLAATNHVTQNVASIPFLWVLPLSIYLLTFILCFDGRGWYRPRAYALASCVAIVAMLGALSWRVDWSTWRFERELLPIAQAVPLYATGLFVLCMLCHGELAARKPSPAHLTRFYLMMSLGGALGGVLVGVVAPLTFSFYWEFPLALAVLALLLIFVTDGWLRPAAAAVFCVALIGAVDYVTFIRYNAIELTRDFYGALRVKETGTASGGDLRRVLLHGVIAHGDQHLSRGRAHLPTTYYGPSSGVARAIDGLRAQAPGRPMRLGVVGLGAGTLATFGRPGDAITVYELNPAVLDVAQRHFTYLRDSAARVDVRLGDARLVLDREPAQGFHVLAVDAFSSDSIPAHLLTREAALLYRRHVADDGVIALHVTNRYIDLSGVTRQLADAIGWEAIAVDDDAPTAPGAFRTLWVLITANRALADALLADGVGRPVPAQPGLRAWTDDYNNLFQVLK